MSHKVCGSNLTYVMVSIKLQSYAHLLTLGLCPTESNGTYFRVDMYCKWHIESYCFSDPAAAMYLHCSTAVTILTCLIQLM